MNTQTKGANVDGKETMIEIDEAPATEETKKDGSDDGFEEFSDLHKDT